LNSSQGYKVLHNGGNAMDAAVTAVSVMEGSLILCIFRIYLCNLLSADIPLFNAGKGAVFNNAGKVPRVLNPSFFLIPCISFPE
jgi:isoaspartyl peptidase/L-asparaginase-like protein (Ntn-hydrolase superfamily)